MFKLLRKTALYILALPVLFTLLGAASNQLVLNYNDGKFPVRFNDAKLFEYHHKLVALANSEDEDEADHAKVRLVELDHGMLDRVHCVMTPATHLNFLADWIDLGDTLSPGDVLLDLGSHGMEYAPFIWAFVAVGKLRKKEEREY